MKLGGIGITFRGSSGLAKKAAKASQAEIQARLAKVKSPELKEFLMASASNRGKEIKKSTTAGVDRLTFYFNQAGRIPLLTKEQEQALGKKVRAGLLAKFRRDFESDSASYKKELKEALSLLDESTEGAIQKLKVATPQSRLGRGFRAELQKRGFSPKNSIPLLKKNDLDGAVELKIKERLNYFNFPIIKTLNSLKKPLTTDERVALQKTIEKGEQAKKQFIGANLRLVISVAKKYRNRGVDFADLIQEGNIGLSKAVEKTVPEKDYKFSGYAHQLIKQEIFRAIYGASRTIKIPTFQHRAIKKLVEIKENFIKTHHCEPSLDELEGAIRKDNTLRRPEIVQELKKKLRRAPKDHEVNLALGVTPENMDELLFLQQKPLSLQLVKYDDGRPLQEFIQDKTALGQTQEIYARNEFRHKLATIINQELSSDSFNPRRRDILERRFGLNGKEEQTLEIVGEAFGVSYEAIRQQEVKGIKQLKTFRLKAKIKQLD